jgi:hypothetical protein
MQDLTGVRINQLLVGNRVLIGIRLLDAVFVKGNTENSYNKLGMLHCVKDLAQ